MAFKAGSLQRDYTLCSQYDDALELPVVPKLGDDASPEDVKARDAVIAERAQKLKVARERNDWASIVKPGRVATIFHFRHIPGTALDWWQGQSEKIGGIESHALLFRLALTKIENLGDFKAEPVEVDGHRMLSAKALDDLYAIDSDSGLGRRVVGELASLVAERTFRGVSPLSQGG